MSSLWFPTTRPAPDFSQAGGSSKLVVNAYGQTDAGRQRSTNQDHFLIASLDRQLDVVQTSLGAEEYCKLDTESQGWVLMVADGMGGHAGGGKASALAVESSLRYLHSTMPWFLGLTPELADGAEETLRAVVRRCHQTVLEAQDGSEHRHTMGTTLTMAYIIWPHLFVVHAGDSRCYLLRDRKLWQLTRDHTVAQELVEQHVLDPDRADDSSFAHVLTKVVGGIESSTLTPDVERLRLQDRDQLLLCSDGLTDMLSDGRICRLLLRESFAKPRCQRLIEAANEAGGADNITVIVASCELGKS